MGADAREGRRVGVRPEGRAPARRQRRGRSSRPCPWRARTCARTAGASSRFSRCRDAARAPHPEREGQEQRAVDRLDHARERQICAPHQNDCRLEASIT